MSLQQIPKDTFCAQYLSGTYAAVAKALLPAGDRTLGEWQQLWQRTLQSPTR